MDRPSERRFGRKVAFPLLVCRQGSRSALGTRFTAVRPYSIRTTMALGALPGRGKEDPLFRRSRGPVTIDQGREDSSLLSEAVSSYGGEKALFPTTKIPALTHKVATDKVDNGCWQGEIANRKQFATAIGERETRSHPRQRRYLATLSSPSTRVRLKKAVADKPTLAAVVAV